MLFKSILKWLGPWLLKQLESVLDPEAAARAKALDEKIIAIEKKEAEAEELQRQADIKYREAEEYRKQRDAEIAQANIAIAKDEEELRASEGRRQVLAQQRKEIEDAITKDKAAIDARSDDERFGGALPGSKPTPHT